MLKELKEFRVKDVKKAWKQWNQIENNKEKLYKRNLEILGMNEQYPE